MEDLNITKSQADELVEKYITNPKTKMHSIEAEAIMKKIANHLGEDEEKWGIIGLLHDIDWDLTKDNTLEHCAKAINILKEAGASDFLVETILSHGYGNNQCGAPQDKQRSTNLQYCLAASETLTGLIIASVLMQPEKKLSLLSIESLKKKFKNEKFASNCDRKIILECEKAGISIDEFLKLGLEALQGISNQLSL